MIGCLVPTSADKMMGPLSLVVVVPLLLCSLAGSVVASIKANCTFNPPKKIDCIVDFSKVDINCKVEKIYIDNDTAEFTSFDQSVFIEIPDGVDIRKSKVTLTTSCAGPIVLKIHNTISRLAATPTTVRTKSPGGSVISTAVKANCTVYLSREIDCIVDFSKVHGTCKVEKSFINGNEVEFTINGRNISMVIPEGVSISESKVTLHPSCAGPIVANMNHTTISKHTETDATGRVGNVGQGTPTTPPPDLPQATVMAIAGSGIAVAIIVLSAGVLVLKRHRDRQTPHGQTDPPRGCVQRGQCPAHLRK
ncbi:uncharacterized protein LOC134459871 isoform X2 [Engraulis encrasicolus]|uniref:uncharacterized protein LOC134459871 isoform X2 n=1 Tax=Engraulis encrasicolus TaxID=184585 RepID=UPI002FD0E2ED